MRIKFETGFVLISMIFGIFLAGCSPKSDPNMVIESYNQSIKDGKFEQAYEQLAEANKKTFSKQDFLLYLNLFNETRKIESFTIIKQDEYKNYKLDGVNYKDVIEYKIDTKAEDFLEGREDIKPSKRYVVYDNGLWKVHRGTESPKAMIAKLYEVLGQMYQLGKGRDKDLAKALEIVNKGIDINPKFAPLYLRKGLILQDLNRYNESVDALNKGLSADNMYAPLNYSLALSYLDLGKTIDAKFNLFRFIELSSENKEKAKGYNLLGDIYKNKENDLDSANKAYKKALELNSNSNNGLTQ